jgi:type II secretory pathway component PulM
LGKPDKQASPRERKLMYIGLGTVVLIVIIVLVIWMLRR